MDVYKRFMTDPGPLITASPVDPALSPEEQAKMRMRMLFAHQQKYKEVSITSTKFISRGSGIFILIRIFCDTDAGCGG